MDLAEYNFDDLFKLALAEDIGSGDVTTKALIDESQQGSVVIVAKQDLTCCGQAVVFRLCKFFDAKLSYQPLVQDSELAQVGVVLAKLTGNLSSILTIERTLLNFLQRLSGIATLTKRYMNQIGATQVLLLDTRKTTPGWRVLEKYAVSIGGGTNHRFGLFDAFMIKDNHLDCTGLSIAAALERCQTSNSLRLKITVEVRSQQELVEAIKAGADRILLDNMTPEELKLAVQYVRQHKPEIFLEASGGVTLANVATIAATGVDGISVGALTHSAPAADISMLYQRDKS